MTVVEWRRTKYGSIGHCPRDPACTRFRGDLLAAAPVDMPRCMDCNQWAAGQVFGWLGWIPPDLVVDGLRLAGYALARLQQQAGNVALSPGAVRHWTVDDRPFANLAEQELYVAGWRQLRAEIHVPREDM